MNNLSHNQRLALLYLKEAIRVIENGCPESAIWRSVDAVHLLSADFPNACGIKTPTGRWAKLVSEHVNG